MSLSNKELLDKIKDEVWSHTYPFGNGEWKSGRNDDLWPIVCELYATEKAKAIASKVVDMQKEIEDNHDGDPWNNGAITTLEEVKKLFNQPIEKLFTRSEVESCIKDSLQAAADSARIYADHDPIYEGGDPIYSIDKSSITDPKNIKIK